MSSPTTPWLPSSRLAPLQEGPTLNEGLLALSTSSERRLGLHHPIHLVLAPLEEAPALKEGLLAALSTSSERRLGLHHPIHLVLALRAARVEGLLHPVALRLQVLAVLLLLGLHRRLRAVLLSRLGDPLVQVRLLLLKGDLLGIQASRLLSAAARCSS